MIVTVFRTRTVDQLPAEYALKAKRMADLAANMPGFISFKTFAAPDGERLSLIEFDSEESMRTWQQHPEHIEVQEWSKKHLYTEFKVQVLKPVRVHEFRRDS